MYTKKISFSPDSVEGADGLDVLGQFLRLRPLEVVDDGDDVTLGLQSRVHLLWHTTRNGIVIGIMGGASFLKQVWPQPSTYVLWIAVGVSVNDRSARCWCVTGKYAMVPVIQAIGLILHVTGESDD